MKNNKTLTNSFAVSLAVNLVAVAGIGYARLFQPAAVATTEKKNEEPLSLGVIHLPQATPTPAARLQTPKTLSEAIARGIRVGKPGDDDAQGKGNNSALSKAEAGKRNDSLPSAMTGRLSAANAVAGQPGSGAPDKNADNANRLTMGSGKSGQGSGRGNGASSGEQRGTSGDSVRQDAPGSHSGSLSAGVLAKKGTGDSRQLPGGREVPNAKANPQARVVAVNDSKSHKGADNKDGIETTADKDSASDDGSPIDKTPDNKVSAAAFIMPKVAKMWNVPPGQKIVLPEGLKLVIPKELPVLSATAPLTREQLQQLRKMLQGQNLQQMKGLTREQLKKMLAARKDAERVVPPEANAAPPPDSDPSKKPENKKVAKRSPRPKTERKTEQVASLPPGLSSPFRYRPWNMAWHRSYAPLVKQAETQKPTAVAAAHPAPDRQHNITPDANNSGKQTKTVAPPGAASSNSKNTIASNQATANTIGSVGANVTAPGGKTILGGAGNAAGRAGGNASGSNNARKGDGATGGGLLSNNGSSGQGTAGDGKGTIAGGQGTPGSANGAGNGGNGDARKSDGSGTTAAGSSNGNGNGGQGTSNGAYGGASGNGQSSSNNGSGGNNGTGDGKNASGQGASGDNSGVLDGGQSGGGNASNRNGNNSGNGAGGGNGSNSNSGTVGDASGGGQGKSGNNGNGNGNGANGNGGVLGGGNGGNASGGNPNYGNGGNNRGGNEGNGGNAGGAIGDGGNGGNGGDGNGGAGGSGSGGANGGNGGVDGGGGALEGFDGGELMDNSEGIAGEPGADSGEANGIDTGFVPAQGVSPNYPEHNHDQQKGLPGALVLPPVPPTGTETGKALKPRPVKRNRRAEEASPRGATMIITPTHAVAPQPVSPAMPPRPNASRPLVAVIGSASRRGTVPLVELPETAIAASANTTVSEQAPFAIRKGGQTLTDRPLSLTKAVPFAKPFTSQQGSIDRVASALGIAQARQKTKAQQEPNSKGIKNGSKTPIPPTPLPDSDAELGDGSGLRGEYFLGRNFEQYQFSRADANLDLFWGADRSPSPRLPVGADWSCRWTGKIMPRYSETYTIYAVADDGVRVWIDHKLIIDDWTLHPLLEYSGTIKLQAGRQYDIRVDYFESGGPPASVGVYWESAHQKKEFIPEECLFYPLAGTKAELAKDEKPHN